MKTWIAHIASLAAVATLALVLCAGVTGCAQNAATQTGSGAQSRSFAQDQYLESGSSDAGAQEASASTAAEATPAEAAAPEEPATPADPRLVPSDSLNEDPPGRHVCYLTFDDGPSSNTHRILDILAQYGLKATWFIKADSGDVEYVKDIWNAGHQIAIHTYSHVYTDIYASTDAFWEDIYTAYDVVSDTLGFEPAKLLRFPGGSINSYNTAIAGTLIAQVPEHGYHYFDWNVSSGDGGTGDAAELIAYTESQAADNNSSCFLMHDTDAKNATVEALPRFIQFFKDKGYEFDVLTEDSCGYHF